MKMMIDPPRARFRIRNGITGAYIHLTLFRVLEFSSRGEALLYISRKRLCSAASPETRQAWQLVKDEVTKSEPELASCMVRECVYRGFCPEMKGCGYADTEAFKKAREDYLRIPE